MPSSLYRAERFANFEGILGFSVLSIIWVGEGGLNSNHNVWTRPPSSARKKKNWEWRRKWRWWVEFWSSEGGRHCFIRASDKNKKDQRSLRSKLVDYSPKQDDHLETWKQTQRIEIHQSQITNMTFELLQVNMCYLRAPLRWLTEQKNPKLLPSFQNEQRDTTNFAVNEHVRTYLCEACLLTSNDCRNDEHSDVTEGKTCEGVCIIWEKSVNITRSVFKFRANLAQRALPTPTIFQWKSSGHEVGFQPPSWVKWAGASY